jgi:hypothetical protein
MARLAAWLSLGLADDDGAVNLSLRAYRTYGSNAWTVLQRRFGRRAGCFVGCFRESSNRYHRSFTRAAPTCQLHRRAETPGLALEL